MRGPLYVIAQNVSWQRLVVFLCADLALVQAALMIFVLDTTIGIGIWIPFMLGKTAALLSVRAPVYLVVDYR
jgi:hypothetical protein